MSSGSLLMGDENVAPLMPDGPSPRDAGRAGRMWQALRGDRQLGFPVGVLALVVLFAILVPIFWGLSPEKQDLINALQGPSGAHPMGTDQLGRDVLARVSEGARISLVVATLIAIGGGLVGGLIGLFAGTVGGAADGISMRVMDTILAFPPLILAMAVTVGLGVGLSTAAIGIALVSVPWYARLLRAEALRIRSLPFIEAAHAMGATQRADRPPPRRPARAARPLHPDGRRLRLRGDRARRAQLRRPRRPDPDPGVGGDDHRRPSVRAHRAVVDLRSSPASACWSWSPRRA